MQEGAGAQIAGTRRSKILAFGMAAAVIAADQLSKSWAVRALSDGRRIPLIGETLDLRLVLNPGSAFGLFQQATILVAAASALITAAVIVWLLRDPRAPAVLGLVVGGGIGNLIDRVIRPPGGGEGHVVDFIYLSFWPTFNLADAAISVGVVFLLLDAFRSDSA